MDDGLLKLGGMAFMGITVLGILKRKAGNVVARNFYPKLAEKWGLQYTASAYKKGVGRLSGTVEGYPIAVDPDDQKRIFVRFVSSPPVHLQSYAHNKRPLKGQDSFRPVSHVLAQQFKTAQASPELIDAFNENEELPATIRPLKFLRALKSLSITDSGISAIFDYGTPSYIPSEVVDDVLPRLLALARIFEPHEET